MRWPEKLYYKGGWSFRQVIWFWWRYLSQGRPFRVGMLVEDCRFRYSVIEKIDVVGGTVHLDDGSSCSMWHCGLTEVEELCRR